MKFLELSEFLNLFIREPQTLEDFIRIAQVKIGNKKEPLTDYMKRKTIDISKIKLLLENIEKRNNYLTRFYKLSLSIDKNKLHIKKDNYSNIVTLCSSCHDKIDTNELVINGWIETTNGKKLDYFVQEKKSKNKYEPEMIEFIKKLKNKFTPQMALIKIKEKYDQKISKKTLDKYWS